jgi:hypothetical protein
MAGERFVAKVPRDNWLLVQLDGGLRQSLPYGLKVSVSREQGGRTYFQILEGVHKGKNASVSQGPYITTNLAHQPPGQIKFDRTKQQLWYGSSGPFSAFSGAFDHFTQVSPGSYDLQIPDAPHSATRAAYYRYTNYHKTWFRIGLSLAGSRYLHVGEISEGCVTVRAFVADVRAGGGQPQGFDDLPGLSQSSPGAIGMPYPRDMAPLAKWDSLYDYLILRRASDQSVGKLTVT